MTVTTSLDHLNLSVIDLQESIDWYRCIFGFSLVERHQDDGVSWGIIRSESGKGDSMLCLYEHADRRFLDRFGLRDEKLHGLNHFALRITDEQSWLQTLAEHNIEILYGGPIQWNNSISWYIKDPTGYEIEVVLWNDRVDFTGSVISE